jgi:hypothetical protein
MASDSEFAMTEFGDLEDWAWLMIGMVRLLLLMMLIVWFVVVGGLAVVICRAHVYIAGMFA